MATLVIILLVIAAIAFAVAAIGVAVGRFNLIALGLLAWVLTILIPKLD